MRTRKSLRTLEQSIGIALIGSILFVLFLSWALTGSGVERVVFLSFAFGCLLIYGRVAVAGVYVKSEGIWVRNLFRTHKVSWDEVDRFELERSTLLPDQPTLHLRDGSRIRIMGIQLPNAPWRSTRPVENQLSKLNEMAREGRSPG